MMPEFLDRPPPGWFVLDVLRIEARKWSWGAYMIDVDPDREQDNYRLGRVVRVRIPGKHQNRDAAWDALDEMMATRH
jgi:hypothetical protein